MVSIALAHFAKMGIYGIFLGTSVSTIVSIVTVAWINYRFLFEKPLYQYFFDFFKYIILAISMGGLSLFIFNIAYTTHTVLNICSGLIISFIVPFGINFVIFGRSEEWKYFTGMIKTAYYKIMRKRGNEYK